MQIIYELREYIKALYAKLDVYIVSLAKFLVAYNILSMINSEIGFFEKINSKAIVLLVSLVCTLLPWGVSVFVTAAFVIVHFYGLSLELAGIAAVLFIIMFCLYLRFGTKDSVFMLVTLLLFSFKLPYLAPIFAGAIASSATVAIPVAFGTIIYYFIGFATQNVEMLSTGGTAEMLTRFKFIIDEMIQNREMILVMITFLVVAILVYTIKKLAIDYAWAIAIAAGAIVNIVLIFIGNMMLGINMETGSIILGTILAVIIMCVLHIFIFAVDYKSKVNVQFEDDEYVYYVKAVPKISADVSINGNGIIPTFIRKTFGIGEKKAKKNNRPSEEHRQSKPMNGSVGARNINARNEKARSEAGTSRAPRAAKVESDMTRQAVAGATRAPRPARTESEAVGTTRAPRPARTESEAVGTTRAPRLARTESETAGATRMPRPVRPVSEMTRENTETPRAPRPVKSDAESVRPTESVTEKSRTTNIE
ncbi:MAG: hypothetical protein IJW18_06185 [Lachnospiraceae bacterium]|nr:hypothetical protein [Lachnospiraceae bacterium]